MIHPGKKQTHITWQRVFSGKKQTSDLRGLTYGDVMNTGSIVWDVKYGDVSYRDVTYGEVSY